MNSPYVILPKPVFDTFKIHPETPLSTALGEMLKGFMSNGLDTHDKLSSIRMGIINIMDYYIINNKVLSFKYFIRVLNYSEEFFDFIVIIKYRSMVKGLIVPSEIVIRYSDLWEG